MHGTVPPSETSDGAWPCWHLNFGLLPPELWENKFLLFQATQFVALCYGSSRTLIQRGKRRHMFGKIWDTGVTWPDWHVNKISLIIVWKLPAGEARAIAFRRPLPKSKQQREDSDPQGVRRTGLWIDPESKPGGLAASWTWDIREEEASRMKPGFWAWVIGLMALPLIKMGELCQRVSWCTVGGRCIQALLGLVMFKKPIQHLSGDSARQVDIPEW